MLVVFHRDCVDGFCCAYLLNRKFPSGRFYGYTYGDEFPPRELFVGEDVVLADISFPRGKLLEYANVAKSFLVLDHHHTAQEELEGLPFCTFDMERCGAMLVWDHFFYADDPPNLVRYVDDHDRWQFKLPYSRDIMAVLRSAPHDLEVWKFLENDLRDNTSFAKLQAAGMWINRRNAKVIDAHVKKAEIIHLGGSNGRFGLATNCSDYSLASEVANQLATETDFGVAWRYEKKGLYSYSLRGKGNQDVSVIAKYYGGGGHKLAAGFETTLTHEELHKLSIGAKDGNLR